MNACTVRPVRQSEAYELACPCGSEFEVPAAPLDAGAPVTCPNPDCLRIGRVEWLEARGA